MFFRRPVFGPRRAFARRSVPDQSGGLRLDRDANDYRPGDGEPIGTPLAHYFAPPSSTKQRVDLGGSLRSDHVPNYHTVGTAPKNQPIQGDKYVALSSGQHRVR